MSWKKTGLLKTDTQREPRNVVDYYPKQVLEWGTFAARPDGSIPRLMIFVLDVETKPPIYFRRADLSHDSTDGKFFASDNWRCASRRSV